AVAGRMGIPTVPLTELYGAAGDYIRERGGEVELRAGVDSFCGQNGGVSVVANGQERKFDYLVMAVPFDVLARMLPDGATDKPAAAPLAAALAEFTTSPITGIHLWFDREISELDHAVLLDRTIQWMFHKSRILDSREKGSGSYVELVVSCSRSLVEKSKAEIVEMAVKELKEFFPGARDAVLVKSTVIKEVHATYSPGPGIERFRPRAATGWPRVFLAGDYTATGWPATMEGAVRSGYVAAEALARPAGGENCKFVVPDLPAAGMMKIFE
ncbi:MAG: FAD-dependent oxidoreductase, partial [Terriglobales bacterium]